MKHSLKTLPEFYQEVIDKKKPFEIRKNDRNFQKGDDVILNEWKNGKYTGRFCILVIKDIFDISFLMPNYIAFTFTFLGEFFEKW